MEISMNVTLPRYTIISLMLFSSMAVADDPLYGMIASGDNGFAFSFTDAVKICPEGTHLPTIREFATISQKYFHAKGILELSEVDPSNIPKGYFSVEVRNPDKSNGSFYYSTEGYQPPAYDHPGDLYGLRGALWTSSIATNPFTFDNDPANWTFSFYNYSNSVIMDTLDIIDYNAGVLCLGFPANQVVPDQPPPDISQIGQIARNADGTILQLKKNGTSIYCNSQGTRLPTPRELAQYAVSMGAAGVKELSPRTNFNHDGIYVAFDNNGFREIWPYRPWNGTEIIDLSKIGYDIATDPVDNKSFWFSMAGYKPSSTDLARLTLRSSSENFGINMNWFSRINNDDLTEVLCLGKPTGSPTIISPERECSLMPFGYDEYQKDRMSSGCSVVCYQEDQVPVCTQAHYEGAGASVFKDDSCACAKKAPPKPTQKYDSCVCDWSSPGPSIVTLDALYEKPVSNGFETVTDVLFSFDEHNKDPYQDLPNNRLNCRKQLQQSKANGTCNVIYDGN